MLQYMTHPNGTNPNQYAKSPMFTPQPSTQKQHIHTHLRRLVHHRHTELRALHTRMTRAIQCGEQYVCAVDGVCLRRVARIGRTDVGGGGVQGV